MVWEWWQGILAINTRNTFNNLKHTLSKKWKRSLRRLSWQNIASYMFLPISTIIYILLRKHTFYHVSIKWHKLYEIFRDKFGKKICPKLIHLKLQYLAERNWEDINKWRENCVMDYKIQYCQVLMFQYIERGAFCCCLCCCFVKSSMLILKFIWRCRFGGVILPGYKTFQKAMVIKISMVLVWRQINISMEQNRTHRRHK